MLRSSSVRVFDRSLRRCCVKKYPNILKWKPKVTLDEGLKITASYYQNKN